MLTLSKQVVLGIFMLAAALSSSGVAQTNAPSIRPGDGLLEVEGGWIFFRVIGSGPGTPVILLHGGPGYSGQYLEPLGALGDDRPVIVYDNLGSGRSDRVTEADTALLNIDRYVRELETLRRALAIDQIHLLGHSWGSMLALEYQATYSDRVVSLILASPAVSMMDWTSDARALVEELSESSRAAILEHEAAGTTSSQEYQDAVHEYDLRFLFGMEPPFPPEVEATIAGYNPVVYGTMWGASEFNPTGNLRDFDRTELLPDLEIPVLFTAGRNDEARPDTIERYAGITPNGEYTIFENSAHLAMVTERQAYIETIRDFLRRADQ